jgi:hypothetical protein|nr:hypothetical protein [uncultured Albidiferax sp.]
MSKNLHTPKPETETSDMQSNASGLAPDALARRRMLLKSLGKGSSVIAAAAIPMHTLASTGTLAKTIGGNRCTVSGMASGIHSANPTTELCKGLAPSRFASPANWPYAERIGSSANYNVRIPGITAFSSTSAFNTVFTGAISSSSIASIMSTAQSSDEAVWITALFNAALGVSTTPNLVMNFPYTPAQVKAMYARNSKASDFFSSNLQSIT